MRILQHREMLTPRTMHTVSAILMSILKNASFLSLSGCWQFARPNRNHQFL